jgi:hypothetical protein
MDDARERLLAVSHSKIKPIEKPSLPSCWHVLKLREGPSYSGLLQQMKPGSIILIWRQRSRTWNGTDRAYTHFFLVDARL